MASPPSVAGISRWMSPKLPQRGPPPPVMKAADTAVATMRVTQA